MQLFDKNHREGRCSILYKNYENQQCSRFKTVII